MTTDTSVKFFHSAMANAPTLSGTAGAMIALLDACLTTGIGSGTVDSVTVAGGIATVTRSAGHPFDKDAVALMAGASPSGLNGEKKVLSISGNQYTYDATGISDQTATGTITHKVAPLGWTKTYTGTNLGAYKPSDVTASGNMLRVDDTGTRDCRVVGYETMSDINTGTGPFPNTAQLSGGGYWQKSDAVSGASRPWFLIGDGRFFYLFTAYSNITPNAYSATQVFGDIASVRSSATYDCVLAATTVTNASLANAGSNVNVDYDATDLSSAALCIYMPRGYTNIGVPAIMRKCANPIVNSNTASMRSGVGSNLLPFPNYPDGGMYVCQHNLVENATLAYRGSSPGFYMSMQNIGTTVFGNRDTITGVTGLAGKTLKAIQSATGVFFVDVTGPWR